MNGGERRWGQQSELGVQQKRTGERGTNSGRSGWAVMEAVVTERTRKRRGNRGMARSCAGGDHERPMLLVSSTSNAGRTSPVRGSTPVRFGLADGSAIATDNELVSIPIAQKKSPEKCFLFLLCVCT
jgi:hypothetical protein